MDITGAGWVEAWPEPGWVAGEWQGYTYAARVAIGPVSYGIDPDTLYKGYGRVTKLALYERLAPGQAGLRRVAAFDGGWRFGRRRFAALLAPLVGALETGHLRGATRQPDGCARALDSPVRRCRD